jgi:Domain of unknown function (DUF4129)
LVALLASACALPIRSAGQQSAGPLSLKQYVQTLDDLLSALRSLPPEKAEDLTRTLAPSWRVKVDGNTLEVSTQTVREALRKWQKSGNSSELTDAIESLELLREQAVAADAPVSNVAAQRDTLNGILALREFRNVRGQSWTDRLKQYVEQLLIKWLGRVFSTSVIPIISNIVVYGLMIEAVLVLAYWMYRSLRESTRVETIMPVPMPVSAKRWPIWLAEARAAAERGDWSDAVHLAYWAGISFLEARGVWRPDVARTPREYLRLLPADDPHQQSLRALTIQFEQVWYSMQTADREQFRRTIAELERLGCVPS